MTRHTKYAGLIVLCILVVAGVVYAQQGYIRFDQGARTMTVADDGKIDIQDGATLEVDSGATMTVDDATFAAATITALTSSSFSAEAKDYVVASDDTLYAAGTYNTSGTSFLARPIAAKYEIELQTGAVAGDWFEVTVADSDSLRIRAATGDSLIAEDGSASNVLGTVAGSAKFTMLLAGKWFIQNATGTWTASLN